MDGANIPVDFVALCTGMGAHAVRVRTLEELEAALEAMRGHDRSTAVIIETDKEVRVPGYESWWDVPIAAVSEMEAVQAVRAEYETAVLKERRHEIIVAEDKQ